MAPHDPERIADHERPRAPEPTGPEVAGDAGAPLRELAAGVGNQAFGAAVARQGHGILPTGEVTPEVKGAIEASRGAGRGLDRDVGSRLKPSLGDLSDVRVHTDDRAHELNHAVSAKAFATGTDVFFAKGEYRPGTQDGDRLLAHELAHVVQQRGAPSTGSLSVSEPGDAMEREADAVADATAR